MFCILVERFFPVALGVNIWKNIGSNLSKLASVTRHITAKFEAICIVCISNNWEQVCWDHNRDMLPENDKPPKTQHPGTKYTNTDGAGSNGEGWTEQGKEFFAEDVLPHVTLG